MRKILTMQSNPCNTKDYYFGQNTHCNCIETILTLLMWFLGHNHLILFKWRDGGEQNTNKSILLLTYKQKILQCVKCTYMGPFIRREKKYLCVSYYIPNSFQSFKSCSIDIFTLIIYANRFKSLVPHITLLRSWQTHNTYIIMIPITEYFSPFSPFERYFLYLVSLLLPFNENLFN